jgi:hypothetical protein
MIKLRVGAEDDVFRRFTSEVNNAAVKPLEHDAEKWVPVFGKHHAPAII